MAKSIPTRFPFINLQKALVRAKDLHEADRNNKGLGIPSVFAAWGYSEKSSGGFQTVGALMTYGILEDEGSNADRRVRFTADGRRYFATELDEDRDTLRRVFARTPPLLGHLTHQWGDRVPPDHVARTYLKTEVGLNDQSARAVLGIYKDNLNYAGHGGDPESRESQDSAPISDSPSAEIKRATVKVGDFVQWTSEGVLQFPSPKRVRWVDESGDWIAVDGSDAGIPASQVEVRGSTADRADSPPPVPPMAPPPATPQHQTAEPLATGEIEWLRNKVGKETTVRLLVAGEMGPREITKLITLLEAQRTVLDDE